MRQLLIAGASGLVGSHVVSRALNRGFAVTALYHKTPPREQVGLSCVKVDLLNINRFSELALNLFPDAIVNACGVTDIAACESDPSTAELLNVALPRQMAIIAHHISARFVHISSEQVFDGAAAPYHHTDMPNPRSLYGRLKLMSEIEVLKYAAQDSVVLRIPLLSGNSLTGNRSLHERLLHKLASGERPKLYTQAIRQVASADNVADVIVELLERPNLSGLFHWAGSEAFSRYELGCRILDHFSLPKDLIEPLESHPYFTPTDLRLDCTALRSRLKAQTESFSEQLARFQVPKACLGWLLSICLRCASYAPKFVKGVDY